MIHMEFFIYDTHNTYRKLNRLDFPNADLEVKAVYITNKRGFWFVTDWKTPPNHTVSFNKPYVHVPSEHAVPDDYRVQIWYNSNKRQLEAKRGLFNRTVWYKKLHRRYYGADLNDSNIKSFDLRYNMRTNTMSVILNWFSRETESWWNWKKIHAEEPPSQEDLDYAMRLEARLSTLQSSASS